jgi:DUF4097 and DUF4098 domain-containing protein YvlB
VRRDETFAVGEQGRVEIHVPAGTIQVNVGEPGSVSVLIDAADADDFEVSQMGEVVAVRQPARWLSRGRNVQVVVRVPSGSDVNVNSAAADVKLRGALGVARLRTASGDVEAEQVARLEITTASGDARIGESDGDATLNTATGDFTIKRVGGRLSASTASGDMRVNRVGGGLEVGTVSGDVSIGRCDGDEIAIKTVSGDIQLGLPSGIRVNPDISTLSGSTRLPDPAPADASIDRRAVRVRVRTVSGDIRIERAG